jgi:hypothetical protein
MSGAVMHAAASLPPVRRFTLFTLIFLFVLLVVATIFQILAAGGPRRFPGPTRGTPLPSITTAAP